MAEKIQKDIIMKAIHVQNKEELAKKVQSLVGHGGMKQVMEQLNKVGLEKGVPIRCKVIQGQPFQKTIQPFLTTAQQPSGSVPQKSTHTLNHNLSNDFDYDLFLNAKDLANKSFEMFMATLLKWGAGVSAKSVGDLQGYLYHLSLICEMAAMSVYDVKTHMDYDKAVRLQAKQSGWQAFKDDNTCLRTIYYMVKGIKQEVDIDDLKQEIYLDELEHGSDQDTPEKVETFETVSPLVIEDVKPDLSESVGEGSDHEDEPYFDLLQIKNVSDSINNEMSPDLPQNTSQRNDIGNQHSKGSFPESFSKPGVIIQVTTDKESKESLPVGTVQKIGNKDTLEKEINTLGSTKSLNKVIDKSKKGDPEKKKGLPHGTGKAPKKYRYPCLYCNQSYGRKQVTIKHVRKVHPENLDDYILKTPKKKKAKKPPPEKFPCEQCDRKFTQSTLLEKHVSIKHFPEGKTFPCNHCNKIFTHPSKERKHAKQVHLSTNEPETNCSQKKPKTKSPIKEPKCSLCDMTFKWSSTLKCHMIKVHKQGGHVCSICGLTCTTGSSLKVHEMRHSGHKRFFCPTCSKGFLRKLSLQAHMKTHTGEKDYMCSTCGKQFATVPNFRRHLLTHTGEKLHKCKSCDKTFTRMVRLKEHSILEHMDVKPHSCTECGKGFIEVYKLNKHLETHSPDKPFICKEHQCGRSFSHVYKLETHLLTQHSNMSKPRLKSRTPGFNKKMDIGLIGNNLNCPHCGKKSSNKQNLLKHIRTHTGEKPFQCSDCGKAFSQQSSLQSHMGQHSAVKPHGCPHCGLRFARLDNLKRHLVIHSDERPLVCSICQKTFRNPAVFSLHRKRHRGEKDHECEICGKCFVEVAGLRNHVMTHTGERPFVCDFCQKGFICKSQLNQHMKRHKTGD